MKITIQKSMAHSKCGRCGQWIDGPMVITHHDNVRSSAACLECAGNAYYRTSANGIPSYGPALYTGTVSEVTGKVKNDGFNLGPWEPAPDCTFARVYRGLTQVGAITVRPEVTDEDQARYDEAQDSIGQVLDGAS